MLAGVGRTWPLAAPAPQSPPPAAAARAQWVHSAVGVCALRLQVGEREMGSDSSVWAPVMLRGEESPSVLFSVSHTAPPRTPSQSGLEQPWRHVSDAAKVTLCRLRNWLQDHVDFNHYIKPVC